MASWQLQLANACVRFGNRGAARRFQAALADPAGTQQAILMRLLRANADTDYGQRYGFARLDSVRAFQDAVPIVDYDAIADDIERVMLGETNVLTAEPVLMCEKSSGSTAASKYIPYTASLRREFQAATSAWLFDLLDQRPAMRRTGCYWSISPLGRQREKTAGGIPIGFEDDTEYFGTLERWILQQLMLVPSSLRHVDGMTNNRYVTLRFLLDRDDLGFVSVWNPSFLTLLVEAATQHGDRLVRDLANGTLTPPEPLPPDLQQPLASSLHRCPRTADRLKHLLATQGRLLGTDLWPDLQLISCWTSGIAARFLPDMTALFPGVEVQGKGLLATEGVVSFPLLGHPGAVVALTSHFYEFLPLGSAERPLLAHELEVGERYTVLMTAGGGLYRYALHDVVEVVGRLGATPLIDFVGKSGKISDVVGEKLNELHVCEVLNHATHDLAVGFLMLAPEWGQPPAYRLFVHGESLTEAHVQRVTQLAEIGLRQNHHYAYARDLGQLGPLTVQPVGNDAAERYLQGCMVLGQRAGDIKPTYLHKAFGWTERFCSDREDGVVPMHIAGTP